MKKISTHTYYTLFDPQKPKNLKASNEDEDADEDEFITDFGKLDLFLAECLNASGSQGEEKAYFEGGIQIDPIRNPQALVKKLKRQSEMDRLQEGGTNENTDPYSGLRDGTIIADRFELKGYIAEGAFGKVYKGHHKQLGINIAIKVLKKTTAFNAEVKERFLREAKIMANVNHPNVVRIYDVGEFHGHVYLVMDYIDGVNLQRFVQTEKKLTSGEYLKVMIQISDALAKIHGQGIIHRDIKPDNIMVTPAGKPILMDFGLAKERSPSEERDVELTKEGICMGTPLYMAPEQFKAPNQATKASDIYSLGVAFYQMVTGVNPFSGETFLDVYENHKRVKPVPAHNLSKAISSEIGLIIAKMMDKNPLERPNDGSAAREAFKKVGKETISPLTKVWLLVFAVLVLGLMALLALYGVIKKPQSEKEKAVPPIATGIRPTDGMGSVDEWSSQPRIYTVIPFGTVKLGNTYFSDKITDFLSKENYTVVERERIDDIIKELNLGQSEYSSPRTAVKVGKLVGAHIIITGNISSYKGKEEVNFRAFNVETAEILGASKVDPVTPETAIASLLHKVANRLVYRSIISALRDDRVELKHGRLHGAYSGMRLRLLSADENAVGVLEVTQADRDKASAKIQVKEVDLKVGMRVEEVKQKPDPE